MFQLLDYSQPEKNGKGHFERAGVVKVKMSNFKRKRKKDKSEYRNFKEDIQIMPYQKASAHENFIHGYWI